MDIDDPLVLQLPSVTVFWEDLGLPKRTRMREADEDWMMKFWDTDIQPWIDRAIKHDYNPHEAGVWFSNRQDAILFKSKWADNIPLP